MGNRNFPVISIATDGSTTTAVLTGAGTHAIPTMSNGEPPKFLHIKVTTDDTVVQADRITINPQVGTAAAMNVPSFILSAFWAQEIILNVHGFDRIARATIGTVGIMQLTFTPLEDY